MFQKLKLMLIVLSLLLLLPQQVVCAETPAIKIQVETQFPPFRYVENGSLIGFDIDFLRLIFKGSDYKIDFSTDDWVNVYKSLKKGTINICGLLAYSKTRSQHILFTKPVYRAYYGFYGRNNIKGLKLNELKKYKIGVTKGHNGEILLKKNFNIKNYKAFNDIESEIKALNDGKVELIFDNQMVIEHFLIKNELKSKISVKISNLFPSDLAFAVKKDDTELVDYMNKRILKLQKSGVYEDLYEHYFHKHSEYHEKEKKKKVAIIVILIIFAASLQVLLSYIYIRYIRKKMLQERYFVNSVFENANALMMIWKLDGTVVRFNQCLEQITGFSEKEIVGSKWMDTLVPGEMRDKMLIACERIIKGGLAKNQLNQIKCKNGKTIDVLWNNSVLKIKKGTPSLVLSTGTDITERNKAERKLAQSYRSMKIAHQELAAVEEGLQTQYEQLKKSQEDLKISDARYKLAIDGVNDGIWDWDVKKDNVFTSERWKMILGYENIIINGLESVLELIHPEDRSLVKNEVLNYIKGNSPSLGVEFRMKAKSGEYKWILARGKAIWDENGKPIRVAGSITDITERKISEEKINYMAYYDLLTGLPNRTLLLERFNIELAHARREGEKIALFFLDLDNFKNVNDTLGHSFGDEMLKIIGMKLKQYIRECDTVARFGADEYILLARIGELEDVTRVAARILELFKQPIIMGERKFYITASIGISIYPNDGDNVQTLLRNSDTAMYKAKELGKGNYQMFTQAMNRKVAEKLEMESSLRHAIENEEFVVYYQPVIDIKTRKIRGMEALLRWNHPENGIVPPIRFIPIAEESGLIIHIGEWVLKKACSQNKAWQDAGHEPHIVSVNLSARQFQQQDLVEMITGTLEETGLEACWLELEVTESLAMNDLDLTVKILTKLREIGIKVSLDDFGTGYSSLNYLKSLPINTLKIDKSFVHDITENSSEEAIAKAVIAMAHSMNLSVTAEGVETEEQLVFLEKQSCDKVQGYYFSKPLPVEDFEKLLKKNVQG